MHTALNRFYAALPRELDSERVTPDNLDAALLVRTCLDDALETGVRLDLTDLQRAELRQTLIADLEGFVRDEAESEMTFVPRRLEVAFGSERAAPELQRGLDLGDGLRLSGKIDGSTSTRSAPAASCRTTSRARRALGSGHRS